VSAIHAVLLGKEVLEHSVNVGFTGTEPSCNLIFWCSTNSNGYLYFHAFLEPYLQFIYLSSKTDVFFVPSDIVIAVLQIQFSTHFYHL
jgi:hypothetical protein